MKWYYFYTSDYGFWHDHLQTCLGHHFDLRPVLIKDLKLSSQKGCHHFTGQPVKLKLVTDLIRQNQNETIVFSDCTLYINRGKVNELKRYLLDCSQESDLVFADNTVNDDVNIGLIMMNCSAENLAFWESCLAMFNETSWDQALVNHRIKESGIDHTLFDMHRIVCNYQFNQDYLGSYYVYKQFISCKDAKSNWNERLIRLFGSGFLTRNDLDQNIRN